MKIDKIDIGKIEIKLGKQDGCIYDDTIFVPMSPSLIEYIVGIFKDITLNDKDFNDTMKNGRIAEYFDLIHRKWFTKRCEKSDKIKQNKE